MKAMKTLTLTETDILKMSVIITIRELASKAGTCCKPFNALWSMDCNTLQSVRDNALTQYKRRLKEINL